MSHTVLDGLGNVKTVRSLGAGTGGDPLVMVVKLHDDALVDDGKMFYHSDKHTVAINAIFNYLLYTAASLKTTIHQIAINSTASPFLVTMYENTIVSANGTAEPIYNQNRTSTTVASSALYMTPTVTSTGTELIATVIHGDKTTGGDDSTVFEMILKPSTNYLLRLENASGGSANTAITLRFSET